MMKRWLTVLPLLTGCYSYAAIPATTAPIGADVRARITGAASDRIAPLIGTFDNRVLIGNVIENNAGVMLLQIPMGAKPNITADVVQLQTRIPVAPPDLVSLERRTLDIGRTTLLAGAIAAGVAAGVSVALRAGGHTEEGRGPPEPPPINRIPIRIWRVPF